MHLHFEFDGAISDKKIEVIKKLTARIIKDSIRPIDLLGVIEPKHWGLLLPETRSEEYQQLCEKIQKTLFDLGINSAQASNVKFTEQTYNLNESISERRGT